MQGSCDWQQTRFFEMAILLLLGDFWSFSVGLPDGEPYYFEGQRSFDPVLKSLDHRAPVSALSSRAKSRDLVFCREPNPTTPVRHSTALPPHTNSRSFDFGNGLARESVLSTQDDNGIGRTLNDSQPQSTRPASPPAKLPGPQAARSHAPSRDQA
jgi:hypothetical protein